MIGLSRMISLAARGGVGLEAILDQLKSCGVCPSYAVRSATKKDCSKGSCCPVAVGNALRDMYEEIQDIICECNKGKDKKLIAYYTPGLYVLNPNETIPEGFVALDDIPKKNGQSVIDAVKEYAQNIHKKIPVEEYHPNPDIIPGGQEGLDALKRKGIYLKKTENGFTPEYYEECPSCHEKTLIHQGGCVGCNSCGFSKCN